MACPQRRTAVEKEQLVIYNFLDKIVTLSVPGLSPQNSHRARSAFVELIEYIGFTL